MHIFNQLTQSIVYSHWSDSISQTRHSHSENDDQNQNEVNNVEHLIIVCGDTDPGTISAHRRRDNHLMLNSVKIFVNDGLIALIEWRRLHLWFVGKHTRKGLRAGLHALKPRVLSFCVSSTSTLLIPGAAGSATAAFARFLASLALRAYGAGSACDGRRCGCRCDR